MKIPDKATFSLITRRVACPVLENNTDSQFIYILLYSHYKVMSFLVTSTRYVFNYNVVDMHAPVSKCVRLYGDHFGFTYRERISRR